MPQVESVRLDVPNGHAFPGWEPGCATTTHPRLSITPRHWDSWSRPRHCLAFLKRKQQDGFASPCANVGTCSTIAGRCSGEDGHVDIPTSANSVKSRIFKFHHVSNNQISALQAFVTGPDSKDGV